MSMQFLNSPFDVRPVAIRRRRLIAVSASTYASTWLLGATTPPMRSAMPVSRGYGVSEGNLFEGSQITLAVRSASADPPRLIALCSTEPIG